MTNEITNITDITENKDDNFFLKGLAIVVVILLVALFVAGNFLNNEKTPSASATNQLSTFEYAPETTPSTASATPSASNPQKNVDNKQMQKTYTSSPKMQLETGKKYTALVHTTDGDMTIELFADKTPVTVNNFVFLAKENFYNGVRFHRIIRDFMVQTGDPEGTGRGGPGYTFADESFSGDYTTGTVAMANAGPDTNGSQFFIMTKDTPLQKDYVIFGKLADAASFTTLDKIANTPVFPTGEGSSPKETVLINSIEIITK